MVRTATVADAEQLNALNNELTAKAKQPLRISETVFHAILRKL